MIIKTFEIPGPLLLRQRIISDTRGHFFEMWHDERYVAVGLPSRFAQDNTSVSRQGVLRGLHFQHPNAQGKLVTALAGTIYDVAVDVRCGSTTFGKWIGCELVAGTGDQLWIPPGFAHGFVVTVGDAVVAYKCSEHHSPTADHCVRWDDPFIGIRWPVVAPILSKRDTSSPLLRDLSPALLPVFDGA